MSRQQLWFKEKAPKHKLISCIKLWGVNVILYGLISIVCTDICEQISLIRVLSCLVQLVLSWTQLWWPSFCCLSEKKDQLLLIISCHSWVVWLKISSKIIVAISHKYCYVRFFPFELWKSGQCRLFSNEASRRPSRHHPTLDKAKLEKCCTA